MVSSMINPTKFSGLTLYLTHKHQKKQTMIETSEKLIQTAYEAIFRNNSDFFSIVSLPHKEGFSDMKYSC
jgi:hypothetical protein